MKSMWGKNIINRMTTFNPCKNIANLNAVELPRFTRNPTKQADTPIVTGKSANSASFSKVLGGTIRGATRGSKKNKKIRCVVDIRSPAGLVNGLPGMLPRPFGCGVDPELVLPEQRYLSRVRTPDLRSTGPSGHSVPPAGCWFPGC
jgi:hypothetical protein